MNFRRDLQFDKEFRYWVYRRLLSFVLAIGLVLWLRNYVALALASPVNGAVTVVLSYAMSSYRPWFATGRLPEIWSFSKWWMLVTGLLFFGRRGEELILGRITTPEVVGAYYVGADLSAQLTQEVVGAVDERGVPDDGAVRQGRDGGLQVRCAGDGHGDHPGAGEMTRTVRAALKALVSGLARDAGIDRANILELAFVGNPIMHHLFLGIDPTELGGAPFALATGLAVTRPAREFDLEVNPGAYVYLLPCIAGHVGADAAGVVLSESPHLSDDIMLVVDVGTNAEIMLGNRDRLLACSSPTGPSTRRCPAPSPSRPTPPSSSSRADSGPTRAVPA